MPDAIPPAALLAAGSAIRDELRSSREVEPDALARAALEAAAPLLAEAWRHPGHRPAHTVEMLRALAAAPDGLTTPEIARRVPGKTDSDCWTRLNRQERLGRVMRTGSSDRANHRPTTWRITDAGRYFIAILDQDEVPREG